MSETGFITTNAAAFVIQLGALFFAVRIFGGLAVRFGLPSMLGELFAGVVVGPYALGGISLPGFAGGVFSSGAGVPGPELYAFAVVASVILFFSLGLETNIVLFLKYSLAGSLAGIGGVVVSFVLGDLTAAFLLDSAVTSPQCLLLGAAAATTSPAITARILSARKKMDSPEGVTILAAAVFDDMLGIICLSVVVMICSIVNVNGISAETGNIAAIAGKAFGIWAGATILGIVFSKKIMEFLRIFGNILDYSILALGIALILAGIFERMGLSTVIGAYIAGISLSRTGIAALIRERIHGIYRFFVPVFFGVLGMMADIRIFATLPVLTFAALFTATGVAAKIIGCGAPALLLGFNARGSLRIGTGMVPRGEMTLVAAGIGLAVGVFDNNVFAGVLLSTVLTTVITAPLLNAFLQFRGSGTARPVKGDDSVSASWTFSSREITGLVTGGFLVALRNNGFYVQMMNIDSGLYQARKNDISLSITEYEKSLGVETAGIDMPFVRNVVYIVISGIHESVEKLKQVSDPKALAETSGKIWTNTELLSLVRPEYVSVALAGNTKSEIIAELVDMLASSGKVVDRNLVLNDIFAREKIMSTGMQHGIALPHAKTGGVNGFAAVLGIKKDGVDFESVDGEKTRVFIMMVSPRKSDGPQIQFLSAASAMLRNDLLREAVISAASPEEVVKIFRTGI